MSKSTPDDLAVAFRSLPRRRSEAIGAAEGAPVGALLAELDAHIAAAATLLGAAADAGAIADAIAARRPEDWDSITLDGLRQRATDAGVVLRRIAAAGPPRDD